MLLPLLFPSYVRIKLTAKQNRLAHITVLHRFISLVLLRIYAIIIFDKYDEYSKGMMG